MKIDANCRLTFEKLQVAFIVKNNLAGARFYYTNHSDVVCCAFCLSQISFCQERHYAFKEHESWSPNYGFIKGVFFGYTLLVLPTSLPHRLSSLPGAATCVGLILS